MTYTNLINDLKKNHADFEVWEIDGGYMVTVWQSLYYRIEYIFDEEYNFVGKEEYEVEI